MNSNAPDAIIVFSAGVMPLEGGGWRATTYDENDAFGTMGGRDRVEAAALLARQYPDAYLVTTCQRMDPGVLPTLAATYAEELRALGVANGRIIKQEISTNTGTSVQQVLKLAERKGWRRLLFVSSEFHLPRIKAFCEREKSDRNVTIVSSESVLIERNPIFAEQFEKMKKTPDYEKRLAAEARGVVAIKNGTYRSAPIKDKEERQKAVCIGRRSVGPGYPTYVIFEVASTHGNDWEMAAAYVEQAADAGADAVKFQLFEADTLLAPLTPGLKGTYDYFKTAETPRGWFPKLKALCDGKGIDLLCTPFDIDSAKFLDGVGVPAIKNASGELTNLQLLEGIAAFGKPIIVSTGMATMEEIVCAMNILRANGANEVVLLQCVSVYPTSFEDANVRAMQTLRDTFGTIVGYSDNGSAGALVPLMAVALGASVIEKHVTAKKMRGSIDDVFSMSIEEFKRMVQRIRAIDARSDKEKVLNELRQEFGEDFDKALGDGIKRPAPHGTIVTHPGVQGSYVMREADERQWARRGIYLKKPVPKGTILSESELILLRPDIGISALRYKEVPGSIAGEDLSERMPLELRGREVFQSHFSNNINT